MHQVQVLSIINNWEPELHQPFLLAVAFILLLNPASINTLPTSESENTWSSSLLDLKSSFELAPSSSLVRGTFGTYLATNLRYSGKTG